MNVRASRRRRLELSRDIGGGGEATVHEVVGQPDLLAKIYKPPPRPGYDRKLSYMRANPPHDPTRARGHTSIAWPLDLLYNDQGLFAGYLMHYIRNAVPLLQVFNPRLRAQTLPGFDWRYLHRTARNLAVALGALHAYGYVVGDLNESNVMVTPSTMVTLIDTDSFQVRAKNGGKLTTYYCPVGKPEYTPPELQGRSLQNTPQYPEHDCFGLGVLIFQLLMNGSHPFRAQWLGSGDPPSVEERIRVGAFPYMAAPALPVAPPHNVAALDVLHPQVANLVRQCFIDGHHKPRKRPTPADWERAITAAESALARCRKGHYFASHLGACPSCGEWSQPATIPAQLRHFKIGQLLKSRPERTLRGTVGNWQARLSETGHTIAHGIGPNGRRRLKTAFDPTAGGAMSGAVAGAAVWATGGAAFGAIGGVIGGTTGQWLVWTLVWAIIWASGWWAFGEVLGETISRRGMGKGAGIAGAMGGALVGAGLGWVIGHRGVEEFGTWALVGAPIRAVRQAIPDGTLSGFAGAALAGTICGAIVWAMVWAPVGALGGAVGWRGMGRRVLVRGFKRVPSKFRGTMRTLVSALEGGIAGAVCGVGVGVLTGSVVGMLGQATSAALVRAGFGVLFGAVAGAVGGSIGIRYVEGLSEKLKRTFGFVGATAGAVAGLIVARGEFFLVAREAPGISSLVDGAFIGLVSGALVGAITGALAGAICGAVIKVTEI